MPQGGSGLVERDVEIAQVDSALRRGDGLILVVGSAGIGKTSILRKAVGIARRRRMRVLSARGTRLEEGDAFGVVRQLFQPTVADATATFRDRLFRPPAATARALLDPQFHGGETTGPASAAGVVMALLTVARRLAGETRLLCAVDDLQWADEASFDVVTLLAPRLSDLGITLIGTVRSGSPESDRAEVLRSTTEAIVIRPRPLTVRGVAALLASELGPHREHLAPDAELCRTLTRGNPFHIRQLAHRIASRSPAVADPEALFDLGLEALTPTVMAVLDDIGPPAKELLLVLAALGDPCPLVDVARVAKLPEDRARRAAETLRRADVLEAVDPLAFVHPLVRGVVEAAIPIGLHRDVAQALEALGASEAEVAAQLARERPNGDVEVVRRLREEARRASSRGLVHAAVNALRRALEEPPPLDERAQVLLELGEAAMWIGDPKAVDHLHDAVGAATEPEVRTRALMALGRLHANAMQHFDAFAVLEQALAEIPPDDTVRRPSVEQFLAVCGLQDVRLADRVLPSVLAVLQRADGRTAELVMVIKAIAAGLTTGSNDDVLAALSTVPSLSVPDPTAWDVRAVSAGLLLACEQYDTVEDLASEAVTVGERTGLVRATQIGEGLRSLSAWARGRPREALRHGEAALEACEVLREPGAALAASAVAALAHLDLGCPAAAAIALDSVDPTDHGHMLTALVYGARATLQLASACPEAAIETIRAGEPLFASMSPAVWSWRSPGVAAYRAVGDHRRAAELAEEELERARLINSRRPIGIALRDAASVAAGDRALALAVESVDVLRTSRAELELARSLIALARLLPADRRQEAQALAAEAAMLAERAAATTVVADALCLLDPPHELTAAEAVVADLVAQGRTNQEVAAELHLSVATVKTHLVHIYDKLAVRNRVELSALWRAGGR